MGKIITRCPTLASSLRAIDATVVVAQHHYGLPDEARVEDALSGTIEIVGINQCKPGVHRAGWMTKVTAPQMVSS